MQRMYNYNNPYGPNPPLPPPSQPTPLNSTGLFFPTPPSQPQQHQFFRSPPPIVQPHMNPSFNFNNMIRSWSLPPPSIAQNIPSLFSRSSNLGISKNRQTLVNIALDHTSRTLNNLNGSCNPNEQQESQLTRNDKILENKQTLKRAHNQRSRSESEERMAITEELHLDLSRTNQPRSESGEEAQKEELGQEAEDSKRSRVSAGNTEDSPASIQLIPTDDESDGENPEMGRNWRMLMLFSGRVKDEDLPLNCERPQTDEGRTFPAIHPRTPSRSSEERIVQNRSTNEQEQRLISEQLIQQCPGTSREILPNNGGFGYVSRSSRVWISNQLAEKQKLNANLDNGRSPLLPPTTNLNTSIFTNSTTINFASKPVEALGQAQQSGIKPNNNRYYNRSLIIFKNGKRTYAGSKECFRFMETGSCLSGIFCEFEHNGATDHKSKKVCPRLLRGQCRNTDDGCPDGPHNMMLPHQMPVCDYYLKMSCSVGKQDCPYMHVKHTDGMEPCEEFNKGCCQRGVMCDSPHRYRYHRVKEKQMERQKQSEQQNFVTTGQRDNESTNSTHATLQWFS